MKIKILSAACAIALLGVTAASAADAVAPPASVGFCGKVVKLVEDHCIGVKSTWLPSVLYEITSAHPKPGVGAMIQGTGVPSGDPTICLQGKHLVSVTWKPVHVCPAKAP